MICEVLVELSNKNIDKTFSYIIPPKFLSTIKIGIRVKVNFNNQELEGFVINIKENDSNIDLKEIISIVDDEVILTDELLELGKYIKDKYLCTLISAYQVMLPKALKASNETNIVKKYIKYIELNVLIEELSNYKFNAHQTQILNKIKLEKRIKKEYLNKISPGSLKTLINKKILKEELVEVYRLDDDYELIDKYPLTIDQQSVVDKFLSSNNKTFLLHGVTGSGKTEVYMEIIEEMLKLGKNSIVLVPEISLTPQIVSRFKKRFGSIIAILHSRLSEGEKYDEYRKIVKGEVNIVIGARSAVFAPLKNIGVIIIDEEHTTSYKQENNPKYSAIDIAIKRGIFHQAKVLLGSATPTLESYARARKGVYELLELKQRINNHPLPHVEIIDMAKSIKENNQFFSEKLVTEINNCLNNYEQIMILQNRRGYSSLVTCSNCGYTEKCPACDISLTYHKTSNMLRCHYCGYAVKKNIICPNCGQESLKNLGMGTEKVYEELTKLFPNAKIVRMDFDTTSTKGSHEKIINAFKEHKYDILLGTQMIAKGLDFPLVTLVGVINADTSLNIPDFRSSEYTFSLLNQVSGRSGRANLLGKVIIQTFNPNHYAISLTKNHDYLSFYNQEMLIRKELGYPPYYFLVSLKVMSTNYDLASANATKVSKILKECLTNSKILGPTTSNVFKINNVYRFSILIKYKKEDNLYSTLNKLIDNYKNISKVKLDIDIDPIRM
ncbi:MAG: primosomal protein N' [Bacilli bacterium]